MRTPAHGGSQAPEQELSDEVEDEAPSGVYMACIFQAGKLGIAVYEAASAEVLHPPPNASTPCCNIHHKQSRHHHVL